MTTRSAGRPAAASRGGGTGGRAGRGGGRTRGRSSDQGDGRIDVPGQMTHFVASLTLDDSKSCVMQGVSCTQRKVSMVPFVFSILFLLSWGGSISFDSFLPSILLLVVIIVMVVIVVVILIVVVVAIIGVVIVVAIIGVVVVVGGVSSILKLSFMISGSLETGSLPSVHVDLTGDEDPTDEEGDTRMGDSTGVSVSLGGEISSGGKKS
ncbi:hypothetical protein Tco_0348848 [Tanacetum coccineum]